jgi:gas vesicle protein
MLAGLLIGAVGGFMSFLRTAIDLGKKAEKQMREKNGAKHEEQP